MQKLQDQVAAVLTGVITLTAAWTLYAQVCLIVGVSSSTMSAFAFIAVPVAAAVWMLIRRAERSAVAPAAAGESAASAATPWLTGLWPPVVIAGVYAWTGSHWLFWILGAAYSLVWGLMQSNAADVPPATDTRGEPRSSYHSAALFALCVLTALLTAGSNRPNADDGYFLNAATAIGKFPEAAPQSFDAVHDSGLPPVEQTLHLPQTYEIGIGVLSNITGVPVPTLYYLILPVCWAVLGTLAAWLFLRCFLQPREALIGTAVFAFVLAFWGDGGRTYGNFGFVRLFQGKAAYLVVVLPFLLYSSFRYRERPNLSRWLVLASCQLAALGFTTNAVVIGPLAALLALAAEGPYDRRFVRRVAGGLSACVPGAIMAALMYPRLAPYRSALSVDDVLLGYQTTMGGARAWLVLLPVLLLPVLAVRARLPHARWLAGYTRLVLLVVLLPLTSSVGSALLGHVFSWRLFWSVPIPLLVSLAAGLAAGDIGVKRWLSVGALALWLIVFAAVGPAAVTAANWSWRNTVNFKVEADAYAAAEAIVSLSQPDALALAPERVAVYMAGLPQAPPLVGVRELYLRKVRGYTDQGSLVLRLALLKYAQNSNARPEFRWPDFRALQVDSALEAIDHLGVSTFAFPEQHNDADVLVSRLGQQGFGIHRMRGFVVAVRSPRGTAQTGRSESGAGAVGNRSH